MSYESGNFVRLLIVFFHATSGVLKDICAGVMGYESVRLDVLFLSPN